MTATTPKQEAVTAAVVASPRLSVGEALTMTPEDLMTIVRANWGDMAAIEAAFRANLASTIPRVADHLEDGGKAEAALRELVEARDALSKANAALNARFRTEQFVRVTMPSPEAERMDAAWSVARRIVVEADPQRTAIGMRREGGQDA